MLFREIIDLISITTTENDMGDPIETPSKLQVFADKQSIRQSEFYQAQTTGLRPESMFVIRSIDYSGQPKLEYNSKTYAIIRTYEKDGELIELVCQGVVNNAST